MNIVFAKKEKRNGEFKILKDFDFQQIQKINGRAKEHTLQISDLNSYLDVINYTENVLKNLSNPKIPSDGRIFCFYSGYPVPNSYEYSRIINKVLIKIEKKELTIILLEKIKVRGNAIYRKNGSFSLTSNVIPE